MNGEACSAACGFCGRCTDGDGETGPNPETCAHPLHWRRETSGIVADGECRLCGASASTITRQRMQDLLTVRDTFASVEDFAAECEKRR